MHVLPDDNHPVPAAPRLSLRIVLPVVLAHVAVIAGLAGWAVAPGKAGVATVRVALVAPAPPAGTAATRPAPAHPVRRAAAPVAITAARPAPPPLPPSPAPVPVPAPSSDPAPVAPVPLVAAAAPSPSPAGADAGGGRAGLPYSAPAFLVQPPPAYPDDLRRQGVEGSVVLRVHVDAQGRPQDVSIDHSSGYAQFDHSAITTVQQYYRFQPAREDGHSVAADVRFAVPFRLSD